MRESVSTVRLVELKVRVVLEYWLSTVDLQELDVVSRFAVLRVGRLAGVKLHRSACGIEGRSRSSANQRWGAETVGLRDNVSSVRLVESKA